jgi:ATP-binding cassette subfamily F protein uup
MPLLLLKQITLSYGAEPLLEGIDFQIDHGERVCLLGRNGAGKTSLMRVITREEVPSGGEVVVTQGTTLARLAQEVPEGIEGSVAEVVLSGLLSGRHEEEWEAERRIEALAAEMALPWDQPFAALSGGMKRRVLMARALAGRPDVLLLDEPTNHLDMDSIVWIERFLLARQPTLFFITHDRAFLRTLATRIVELDRGRLTSWACGYDEYLIRRAAGREAEEKHWEAFDKKLAQEEVWLRQGIRARRTRNEGRVRMLEDMREERRQRRAREGLARLELQDAKASGHKVIEAKAVSFAYDGQLVIDRFSATIWRGDKIGILGPNGSGKTTLLKVLLGQLPPHEGEVVAGTHLEVLYLDQLRGQINDELTVAQNVAGDAETVTFQGRSRHLHGYLQDFLFRSDRIRMPARRLSGGERNRLLLAKLFLQPANMLILDEPTNDLDAETLELLEELLGAFEGTLLLVSHDREFLDHVVTSTWVFEGAGRVTEYAGGYEDWLRQRPAETTVSLPAPAGSSSGAEAETKGKSQRPRKFLNREKRELEDLPSEIEKLEHRHRELAGRLGDPEVYRHGTGALARLQTEIATLDERLRQAYARWEELEILRESCQATPSTS